MSTAAVIVIYEWDAYVLVIVRAEVSRSPEGRISITNAILWISVVALTAFVTCRLSCREFQVKISFEIAKACNELDANFLC